MKPKLFKVGDEVCGKASDLKGRVTRVIDYKWVEVFDYELEMEVTLALSTLTLVELTNFGSALPPPLKTDAIANAELKKKSKLAIDLHLSKIPAHFQAHLPPLGRQMAWLQKQMATANMSHCQVVELIHGKGAGKLHQEVLKWAKQNPMIKRVEIQKVALELPHAVVIYL